MFVSSAIFFYVFVSSFALFFCLVVFFAFHFLSLYCFPFCPFSSFFLVYLPYTVDTGQGKTANLRSGWGGKLVHKLLSETILKYFDAQDGINGRAHNGFPSHASASPFGYARPQYYSHFSFGGGHPFGMDMDELFEELFTGGARRRHWEYQRRSREARNTAHRTWLELTLEDLFTGCEKTRKARFNSGVERVFTMSIPKGTFPGKKFKFSVPEENCEMHFVVAQKPHETFTRKDQDLIAKVTVPFSSIFSRYTFQVKQLNGKKLKVTADGPFYPGKEIFVSDRGMHYVKDGEHKKGDLYLKVELPYQRLGGTLISLFLVGIVLAFLTSLRSSSLSKIVDLWGIIVMFLLYLFIAAL